MKLTNRLALSLDLMGRFLYVIAQCLLAEAT